MCRALQISEQSYYRAIRRPEKGWRDRQLLEQIYACLREDEENGDNYGVRRILAWLRLAVIPAVPDESTAFVGSIT